MTKIKILIIGPHSFGYLEKLHKTLKQYPNVQSNIHLIDRVSFRYKNYRQRVFNFFTKTFLNINIKHGYTDTCIVELVEELGHQDIIFMIRPDYLKPKTLNFLKTKTSRLEAFYYDSTRRYPAKVKIIPIFDKIYSYDKLDVQKFNFEFLTNNIYNVSNEKEVVNTFFNISSYDYRFEAIERLAKYIQEKNWTKEILVLGAKDRVTSDYVTLINEQMLVDDVNEKIKKSKIIIEIQREDQIGLSYRVFEALGHNKKLITTNADIVNYDFYNPQNILVIDEDNIHIPEEFVESPYADLDEAILSKYKIEEWIKPIFDLK